MEWLYSRYPGGAVGGALLLLRVVTAAYLVHDGVALGILGWDPGAGLVEVAIGAAVLVTALLLTLGLRTPLAGSAGAACLIAIEWHARFGTAATPPAEGWFHTACFAFVTALLVILGPGGYSIDARMPGWRRIDW